MPNNIKLKKGGENYLGRKEFGDEVGANGAHSLLGDVKSVRVKEALAELKKEERSE